MKHIIVFTALCVVLAGSAVAQDGIGFVYQGRVNVPGGPFNGSGLFKFAIFTKDGPTEHYLWFNDGDTTQTEPANPVSIEVIHGTFSILIGDTSLPNMAPLSPTLFNTDNKLWLRTWFNDGTHGFEQLNPDKRIVNPELIGIHQPDTIDLYVNDATGNDHFSGLTPSRPKKTIQAAVNALPPVIEKPATIHIADGVYRELVLMKNIRISGNDGSLKFIGNTTTPQNVVISGADAGAPTTPVRDKCVYVVYSDDIEFEGIQFSYATEYNFIAHNSAVTLKNVRVTNGNVGVQGGGASFLIVQDSTITDCFNGFQVISASMRIFTCILSNMSNHGIYVLTNGDVIVQDTSVTNTAGAGMILTQHSYASVTNSTFSSNGTAGFFGALTAWGVSHLKLYDCTIQNCTTKGIWANENSWVEFRDMGASNKNELNNCTVGCLVEKMSGMDNMNSNGIAFTSCPTKYTTATNSYVYNFPAP